MTGMWPFKRKKTKETLPPCPYCGSTQTAPRIVKSWRGERYVSYRCAACGRDFYDREPPEGMPGPDDGPTVEDEDALRAAEEEVRKQADEDGDHTYPSGGP